jgi:hypothetical protein
MSSVSGLSKHHRAVARKINMNGCHMMLNHASIIHYTQGSLRWSGIDQHKRISHRQFPYYGDCSSTVTWLLWNALHVKYGVRDLVNGEHWRAGYTGTIATHGKRVHHDKNIEVGDLILYGDAPTYEHVAISMGGRMVFSHGSEGGPYYIDRDYRDDRGPTRRFI